MTSTRKIQLALLASVLLLLVCLWMQPIKGLINPPGERQTAKKAEFSLEEEIRKAKKGLSTSDLNAVTSLEENAESEEGVLKLATKWESLGFPYVGSFYYLKLAEKSPNAAGWMRAAESFSAAFRQVSDSVLMRNLANEAISCYTKVLELDTANSTAKTGLAACYVEGSSNPMQGIQMLLQIVKEDPENYQANLNLGMFSMRSGQFEKAIKRFETLLKSKPDAEVWFYLAEAYKGAGNKQQAIAAYEECIKMLPDEASKAGVRSYINELKNS